MVGGLTHESFPGAERGRRAVILVTPLALVGLLLTHGSVSETGRQWYLTLHFLLLPLFALVALSAWWLLRGLRGRVVSLAGLALGVFVVCTTGLDVSAGIVVPTLQNYSFRVPQQQAPWVYGATDSLTDSVGFFFNVGSWAWVAAMIACAVALQRAGRPWPPLVLLVLSGLPLAVYNHGRPWGPIGFITFFAAALWLEFWPGRQVFGHVTGKQVIPLPRWLRRSGLSAARVDIHRSV